MLDNALEPYISHQKSPSSGRALLALETQGSAQRPIRTGIAGEEADRAAKLSGQGTLSVRAEQCSIPDKVCSARPRFLLRVHAGDE